jgi:hypothetical protein
MLKINLAFCPTHQLSVFVNGRINEMKLLITLYMVLIITYLICYSDAQNLRKRKKPKDISGSDDPTKLFKALQVNYPLKLFNPSLLSADYSWRDAGKYNSELARVATETKEYVQIGRAQDQEDVWLFENWFFGVQNGIIMESGALDGLLFSNSYMFETFAKWTAIHVGEKLSASFLLIVISIFRG